MKFDECGFDCFELTLIVENDWLCESYQLFCTTDGRHDQSCSMGYPGGGYFGNGRGGGKLESGSKNGAEDERGVGGQMRDDSLIIHELVQARFMPKGMY